MSLGPEWGLHPASVAMLCERIDMFNALTWRQVVEVIEQLATASTRPRPSRRGGCA